MNTRRVRGVMYLSTLVGAAGVASAAYATTDSGDGAPSPVVALATGMQVHGDGVDLFGLVVLALIVNFTAAMWAASARALRRRRPSGSQRTIARISKLSSRRRPTCRRWRPPPRN